MKSENYAVERESLRLGLPSKGRMAESTLALLRVGEKGQRLNLYCLSSQFSNVLFTMKED